MTMISKDGIYGNENDLLKASGSFDVLFTSPCEDPTRTTITPTTQNPASPATDDFSETDMVFTYVPYTVVPAFCPLTVSCTSFDNPVDSDQSCDESFAGNVIKHSFSTTDYTMTGPGDYKMVVTVSSGGSDASLNPTFDVVHTLTDPCLTAVVTAATNTE